MSHPSIEGIDYDTEWVVHNESDFSHLSLQDRYLICSDFIYKTEDDIRYRKVAVFKDGSGTINCCHNMPVFRVVYRRNGIGMTN